MILVAEVAIWCVCSDQSVSAGVVAATGGYALLVWNTEIAAVAAAHKVDPDRWWAASGALIDLDRPPVRALRATAARGRADAGHA